MKWRDEEFQVVPTDDPRIATVIDSLRATRVNGGVVFRVFTPTTVAASNVARFEPQAIDQRLRFFLEAPSVRMAVPELRIPTPLARVPRHTWFSGFEFEGAMTHLLLAGGAYVSSNQTESQA